MRGSEKNDIENQRKQDPDDRDRGVACGRRETELHNEHGNRSRADDADDGGEHRTAERDFGVGHHEQPVQTECEIDELGEKHADHVAVYADLRHQRPNENHAHRCVDDVVYHRIELLSEPFEHAVDGRIEIHDGDERGEYSDILCGLLAAIYQKTDGLRKAEEDPGGSDAEEQREA